MTTLKFCLQTAIVYAVVFVFSLPVSGVQKMEIVKNGQPNAVIVVEKDAPRMVAFAAAELQTYLQKISGAKLDITNTKPASGNVIYVGQSQYTRALNLSIDGLKPDGFKIITGDGWLALYGRETEPTYGDMHPFVYSSSYDPSTGISKYGETGSLYAVYRFLEDKCGVRWYMPGEIGEVVPKANDISIGKIKFTKSPDLPYRHMYYTEFWYGKDENLWYRRAGFGAQYPISIMHSFVLLKKYAKEHPEYFSLIDGQRDYSITSVGDGSLCLSNPGTLKAFVNEANEFFDKNPGQGLFPVMPNDGWDRMCQCEDCQKWLDKSAKPTGTFSEYVWNFVDRVAKEVLKAHPDKLIGCCAYANYLDPPKKIEKLSPNVAVMICKMRLNYWDKAYEKKINADMDIWNKKSNNIFIWEYYIYATGYDLTKRGLPIFFPTLIGKDLKHLKPIIKGEFVEAESWIVQTTEIPVMHNKALIAPILYLTGKLYWDMNLNPQKLMDEYCKNFYGPAAKDLRTFWRDSEKLWMSKSPDEKKDHSLVFTPEAVNALMVHLNNGLAKTSEGSLERKRIEALIGDVKPKFDRLNNPLLRTRPKLTVPYTSQAPALDGNLDDAAWKNAVRVDFCDAFGDKPLYNTHGFLTWDEKNLYLAFVNEDPNPTGIQINHVGKDADFIWDDEVNELFFRDEKATEGEYYQYIINAGASIWDAHFTKGDFTPAKWTSSATANSSITNDGWILEVAIPLSDLGLAEGKTITANLYRSRNNKDISGATRSCWSPNTSDANYVPDRFGYLTLKK